MRHVAVCFALSLFASSLIAGQVGPNTPPVPIQNGGGADDTILKDLLMEMAKKKPIKSDKGVGTVSEQQAKICEICQQPLYKHSDPNFECIPIDPLTGKPKHVARVQAVPTQCPVCSKIFKGAIGEMNDRGGRDRDFCPHPVGKACVPSTVWLCPECGYAALAPLPNNPESPVRPELFQLGLDGKPLDEATKKFVQETLTQNSRKHMVKIAGLKENEQLMPELMRFSEYVSQELIPDYMKYDNAIQIYEHIKAPHTLLAKLSLEGAHSCRRLICSEVSATALDQQLQDSLGKAINRINREVQSVCIDLRRQRKDPMIDARAETDPRILVQAAAVVLRRGKDPAAAQRAANANTPAAAQTFYTNSDMFVAYIIYAGSLDRLGRYDDAEKAMNEALAYIPEKITLEDKDLQARVIRQLKVLRGIVEERIACLNLEQKFLSKAAAHNMAAIKFSEIKFMDSEAIKSEKTPQGVVDAAPTSYLLGELFRRCGEPEIAAAWFAASSKIIDKSLDLLDQAESTRPPVQAAAVTLPQDVLPRDPFAERRERLLILRLWAREQAAGLKVSKAPDAAATAIIEKVLATLGLKADALQMTPADSKTPAQPADTQTSAKAPDTQTPVASSTDKPAASVKTREELLKLYYAALKRYRTDKKENPQHLTALVEAGYISADASGLDKNGALLCPETGEKLLYMKSWEPGDAEAPVIFPLKSATKALYANGEIRERVRK